MTAMTAVGRVVDGLLSAGPKIIGRPVYSISIDMGADGGPPHVAVHLAGVTSVDAARLFTAFGAPAPFLSRPYGKPGQESIALEGPLPDGPILRIVMTAAESGVL